MCIVGVSYASYNNCTCTTHNCLNGGCIQLIISFYLTDKTIFGHYRVVAMVEKFYDILERIHSLESGHVGYKKNPGRSMFYVYLL